MILTLKEARDNLYKAVVPNLDSQANIDLFNQYINWAQERLINSGLWNGLCQHVAFAVPTDFRYISLPPQYVSVDAMSFERTGANGCVSSIPVRILNQWLGILTGGPFLYADTLWPYYGFCNFSGYTRDRGDGFVIFRDSPFLRYYLKFKPIDADDAGQQIVVKGYDENGDPIFTPDSSCAYEGYPVTLEYPSVTASQIFTKQIYFLQKPCTHGYVELYAVDEDTAEEIKIGHYQPTEINPCYRRYNVGDLSDRVTTIRTICKRRYYPSLADTDEVFPANLGALRLMLAGLKYETENDPGRYQTNFDMAIKLLNDEVRAARGGAALKLNIDPQAYAFERMWPGR